MTPPPRRNGSGGAVSAAGAGVEPRASRDAQADPFARSQPEQAIVALSRGPASDCRVPQAAVSLYPPLSRDTPDRRQSGGHRRPQTVQERPRPPTRPHSHRDGLTAQARAIPRRCGPAVPPRRPAGPVSETAPLPRHPRQGAGRRPQTPPDGPGAPQDGPHSAATVPLRPRPAGRCVSPLPFTKTGPRPASLQLVGGLPVL